MQFGYYRLCYSGCQSDSSLPPPQAATIEISAINLIIEGGYRGHYYDPNFYQNKGYKNYRPYKEGFHRHHMTKAQDGNVQWKNGKVVNKKEIYAWVAATLKQDAKDPKPIVCNVLSDSGLGNWRGSLSNKGQILGTWVVGPSPCTTFHSPNRSVNIMNNIFSVFWVQVIIINQKIDTVTFTLWRGVNTFKMQTFIQILNS